MIRLFTLVIGLFLVINCLGEGFTAKKTGLLMGSSFEVVAVSNDSSLAKMSVEMAWQEIERLEKMISSWDTNSETHRINKNAGIQPVVVSVELYQLIKRCKKISDLTEGAFDISYAALDNLWDFKDTLKPLPSEEEIKQRIALVGSEFIRLEDSSHSVFLMKEGMKIGFGAIGKGFAANKARKLMIELGIKGGLVNAGGDLIAWGKKADGSPWTVGIADPNSNKSVFSYLNISNGAVVTSGNYERFKIIDGKRYAHILDPRTGYPVTGLKSVTILCPDAELADGLATSVFVLGEVEGKKLINNLSDVECILVTDDNRLISSPNVKLNE